MEKNKKIVELSSIDGFNLIGDLSLRLRSTTTINGLIVIEKKSFRILRLSELISTMKSYSKSLQFDYIGEHYSDLGRQAIVIPLFCTASSTIISSPVIDFHLGRRSWGRLPFVVISAFTCSIRYSHNSTLPGRMRITFPPGGCYSCQSALFHVQVKRCASSVSRSLAGGDGGSALLHVLLLLSSSAITAATASPSSASSFAM